MKNTASSFGYAISGLAHAMLHEENLRRFLVVQILFCLAGSVWSLSRGEWFALISSAVLFLITELLNTAIERLADTLDDLEKRRNAGHYHSGIRITKDVAASASLTAFLFNISVLVLIFVPRIITFITSYP